MKRKKWKNYLSVALCASMIIAGSNARSTSGDTLQKLVTQGTANTQAVENTQAAGSQTDEVQTKKKDGQNVSISNAMIESNDGGKPYMKEKNESKEKNKTRNEDKNESNIIRVLEI